MQRRRDKASRETDAQAAQAKVFVPDVLVTDKLRSYGAARSEIGLSAAISRVTQ